MNTYLFDIDGTLTPSRDTMNPEFKAWFKQFMTTNRVALITGGDISNTIQQLGEDIVNEVLYSFNCSGNVCYSQGKVIYQSDWVCPDDLQEFLTVQLAESKYPKYGEHIQHRIGMVNFSTVGRNASKEQRSAYYEWDKVIKQRETIAKKINEKWENIQAVVGGETSIDIMERGFDKSQILNFLVNQDIIFFGDAIYPGGNDFSLATAIRENNRGLSHSVKDWQQTFKILQHL